VEEPVLVTVEAPRMAKLWAEPNIDAKAGVAPESARKAMANRAAGLVML